MSACTCGSLRKASRRVSQFYDAALAPVKIRSTQYAILSEVDRRRGEGPVTMCELAGTMVMDRSTLGHNLRPLQRDDLLVLRRAERDKRKRYVELTLKGRTVLKRAHLLWQHAERRFENLFGEKPAAELRKVLLCIANNKGFDSPAPF